MTKDTFVLLAKFNKTANAKMDGIIKTLSPEEWDRPLGGYFKSVRGLCSHLYICDFNWLKRFPKIRDFAVLKEPLFDREPYSYAEVLFADKGDYFAPRASLDEKIIAFADELKDADLSAALKYSDARGNSYERNFGGLILHFFNHQTHHRGMISLCLEMLGRENDFNGVAALL
jgi:uncharacterized damage-inducible protein DinB